MNCIYPCLAGVCREAELEDLTVTQHHLAVLRRVNGVSRVTAYRLPWPNTTVGHDDVMLRTLPEGMAQSLFEEDSYHLGFGDQGPFDSDVLRLRFSSFVTPDSVYDVNLATGVCIFCILNNQDAMTICGPVLQGMLPILAHAGRHHMSVCCGGPGCSPHSQPSACMQGEAHACMRAQASGCSRRRWPCRAAMTRRNTEHSGRGPLLRMACRCC